LKIYQKRRSFGRILWRTSKLRKLQKKVERVETAQSLPQKQKQKQNEIPVLSSAREIIPEIKSVKLSNSYYDNLIGFVTNGE